MLCTIFSGPGLQKGLMPLFGFVLVIDNVQCHERAVLVDPSLKDALAPIIE